MCFVQCNMSEIAVIEMLQVNALFSVTMLTV